MNGPSPRVLNSTTDATQNYRNFLLAKITSVNTPTTGPLAGRKVYEWTEQIIVPADGSDEDAPQPRKGVYTSETEWDSVILDPNDASFAVGDYVYARMKGSVGGVTVYESVAGFGAGFEAQLTSRFDSILAYSWKKLDLVLTPIPPHFVNSSPLITGNKAVSFVEDRRLSIGTKGWMVPYGPGYVFIHKGRGTGGNGDCDSDAWLKWLPTVLSGSCWTIYRRSGTGRSIDFGEDDPDDPHVGIVAVYRGDNKWTGAAGKDADGGLTNSGMLTTCCGCGSVTMEVMPSGEPGKRAKLTLGGVHVSCVAGGSGSGSGSGGGEAVFSYVLTDYCVGLTSAGDRYIEFIGSDPRVCNADPEFCGNEFRIMAVCSGACPSAGCGCLGCGPAAAPTGWIVEGITGMSDDHYNGDWVWSPDPTTPCKYTARCNPGGGSGGGYVSTIEFVLGAAGVTDGHWLLSHGGATYQIAYGTGVCNGVNAWAKTGGTGPASLNVRPLRGSTEQCCSGLILADLPATMTVSVTAPSCPTADGLSVVVTYDPGPDHWIWTNPSAATNRVTTVTVQCSSGVLTVAVAGVCGAFTFAVAGTGYAPTGTPTISPLDVTWVDVPVAVQVGATCCADGLATVSVSA